jgi:hypothetical protein
MIQLVKILQYKDFTGKSMKRFYIFAIMFFIMGGAFYINAQDLIILKSGSVIEAKVTEISPSEIRYKRFDHLEGPTIVIPAINVLSIRYENGMVEVINNTHTDIQSETPPTNERSSASRPGVPVLLQQSLNSLPAIRIAGNNLKFEFSGETWIAKVNGRNFLEGTVTSQDTDEGSTLTLKQTHTYVARRRISTPGPDIILEYKRGPPASLRQVSRSQNTTGGTTIQSEQTTIRGTAIRYDQNRLSQELEHNTINFPSVFNGIWKRDNFENSLTFTTDRIYLSSSPTNFASLVDISDDLYTFVFSNNNRKFTITIKYINNNIEITGGTGSGQGNLNGTWRKQ